jgi:hypothetical protein
LADRGPPSKRFSGSNLVPEAFDTADRRGWPPYERRRFCGGRDRTLDPPVDHTDAPRPRPIEGRTLSSVVVAAGGLSDTGRTGNAADLRAPERAGMIASAIRFVFERREGAAAGAQLDRLSMTEHPKRRRLVKNYAIDARPSPTCCARACCPRPGSRRPCCANSED